MKKLLLILSIICFSTINANAATDNVLQSIQIDSYKDTYNIILKSDEKPETKRIITDENKMMLSLKGVRASEELNTIYNAMNIDSVTVEPVSSDSVNISIQAENVSRSNLVFDTLDTPLGVLRTKETVQKTKKVKKKVVLSHPVRDYRPVYSEEETTSEGLNFDSLATNEYAGAVMSVFKDEGVTNTISFMLIALIALCTYRLFKKNTKDNMQIGLSQSLRDREIGLMQDMMSTQVYAQPVEQPVVRPEMNYGIRSYQNAIKTPYQQHGMKSPYTSSDIQIKRPAAPQQPLKQESFAGAGVNTQRISQSLNKAPISGNRMTAPQQRVANVDSMKFLDSMAKIYEKNGRADLAQGLKANINKAKSRV